jgi:hypothetical protein
MAPYPYLALHIASARDSDQDEAADHAGSYSMKGEMRSAGTADQLYDLFVNLGRHGAQLAYLDFHCHGYPGALDLGRDTFDYSDLDKFRRGGFSALFRGNAVISFLSCDLGGVNIDQENEDGELFLAEFALIFLGRNGGKAVASNLSWHYRPSTFWRDPIFKTAGTQIAAEVAPGATRAMLKGQYRLDETRINLQIAVLRSFIAAALDSLPGRQLPKSYLQDSLSGPAARVVAEGVRMLRSEQIEKNRHVYTYCLKLLDDAKAQLRTLSPEYYLKYHNACKAIEDVTESLTNLDVPWSKIIPPIMNMMQGMPVAG